tara:strand:- start:161 stop:409 length:249 start_codon:yes stop_codon:yes gene_type:complete
MGVKDTYMHEECMKELDTFLSKEKQPPRSFGKYFDDQRDRIVKDMQNCKNAELYNAWREDFDKRLQEKRAKKIIEEINNAQI